MKKSPCSTSTAQQHLGLDLDLLFIVHASRLYKAVPPGTAQRPLGMLTLLLDM